MNVEPKNGRILVVDDTEYNRDLLERRLSRRGFEVDAVEDGYAALEALAAREYALVLLDIMMPGMDGYEVLERARETRSPTELPIIMVTAKDESADVVRALKLGANDYITKPIDFAVALARVNTQLLLVESQASLRSANERMKRDLQAAARTQRRLLPSKPIVDPRIAIGWEYQPCDELGGDMLNVFRLDEDHIGLYVLDVSGHGVRPSLLSFAVSLSLSPDAGPGSMVFDSSGGARAPGRVAERLNAEYSMAGTGGLMLTLLYGIIDLAAATFTYVSAGHPDPVRLSNGEEVSALHSVGGPPVGVLDGAAFVEQQVALSPGDRITVISDGVYEQFNEAGDPYGWDRFLAALAASRTSAPSEASAGLVRAVEDWAGSREKQDDVSVVIFDYQPGQG